MKEFEQVMEAVLGVQAEAEAKIPEVFKAGLSDKAAQAVKASLRILNAFKEELPKDVMGGLAQLAGYGYPEPEIVDMAASAEAKACGEPGKKTTAEEQMRKSMDALPAEVKAQLETLWKEREEAKVREDKLAKELKASRDEQLRKDLVAKAEKDFGKVPGMSADEKGALLMQLHTLDPQIAASVEKLMAASQEALSKSALLEERGKSAAANAATVLDSWAKIEKLAKELVSKDSGMSQAKAVDAVLRQHPELYQEYLLERQQAVRG